MSDTLGSLSDKLSIVNIKLFMVQDDIHAAAKGGFGLTPDLTKKLVDLNIQRNRLITEMDELLARSIKTGHADVDPRTKL